MNRLIVVLLICMSLATGCGATPATGSVSATDSSTSAAPPRTSSGASSADQPDAPTRQTAGSVEIQVFAAASLTNAFREIGERFDAEHNTKTTFNFAGSQQLAQQITQGAPADVFASANNAQMEQIIKAGQVSDGTQRVFARNRLVVIYPHDNPAQLARLEDLAKPGVKLVLAAKAVPVGQYALDFLRKASEMPQFTTAYSQTVLANVVSYEENVRAVLSKVSLGEADAGIVYTSDIAGGDASIGRIEIPDSLNTIATYPIAPLTDSPNAQMAQSFVEYVLSSEGQSILGRYGFLPASP